MIRFSCPGCGAVYSVTDEKAGKTGKCPKCQTPFTIPAAEAPAPVAPPPPPPKPSSNPFAELAADDAPRKKKPSKADLDDDFDDRPKTKGRRDEDDDYDDAPKKKPARAVDDDEDRPKKKPRRDDDEDDYDDAPKKKKAPSKAELDDEDDRPRKKSRRDEDDDDYDAPKKKKPARAAADDDFDDEDDRPRKKKGKSGLLLTAAILEVITAALYVPCGGLGLFAASVLGFGASTTSQMTGTAVRLTPEGEAFLTFLQVLSGISLIAGITAIPACIGCFTKKKWCVMLNLAVGGLLILLSLVYMAAAAMYSKQALDFVSILFFLLLPLSFGVVAILAATNKNVKRVLS